jgi:hypothetical protein
VGSVAKSVRGFSRHRRIVGDRVLRHLETFVLFAAVMVAIIFEAGCVYWLWTHEQLRPTTRSSFALTADSTNLLGLWSGPTLPQCWLLGALLVLIYRLVRMTVRPESWDSAALLHNRHAFLRLWRWAIALTLMQGLTLYLGGVGTPP